MTASEISFEIEKLLDFCGDLKTFKNEYNDICSNLTNENSINRRIYTGLNFIRKIKEYNDEQIKQRCFLNILAERAENKIYNEFEKEV